MPETTAGRGEGRTSASRAVLSTLFSLVLLLSLSACDRGSSGAETTKAARTEQGQQLSPEERRVRELKAKALYEQTRKLAPDEKVGALSDVAQMYPETEVAPQVFLDLVFYLSDHSNDRFEDALKALETFVRRRPEAPNTLGAANVLYGATTKKLATAPEAMRAKLESIRDQALAHFVAAADHLIGSASVKDDVGAYYDIGTAFAMVGRFAEAERAWARVEDFETPAEDTRRVDLIIRRADLLRSKLDRKKEALDLFIQARDIQATLGRAAPKEMRDYVNDAITSLRG